MLKKKENSLEDAEEIKSDELLEIIKSGGKPSEETKGRQEEDYFFPDQRVTIKASSLNEAIKKLKEGK